MTRLRFATVCAALLVLCNAATGGAAASPADSMRVEAIGAPPGNVPDLGLTAADGFGERAGFGPIVYYFEGYALPSNPTVLDKIELAFDAGWDWCYYTVDKRHVVEGNRIDVWFLCEPGEFCILITPPYPWHDSVAIGQLPAGTYHVCAHLCSVTGGEMGPVVLVAETRFDFIVGDATALSSGYVFPQSGSHATTFTWRVKYWDTGNEPPDGVYVAIWFPPPCSRTYWYPMWAYNPSDTDYRDGAWYTFSRRWMPPGTAYYRFAARQGADWVYWPQPAGTYHSGPTVGP